jgi:hypothetical protein
MRILHPDFRDENLSSRYPFADGASLVSRDGIALGPETFLDATIYPIGGGERAYLSALVVANREITVWVGDIRQPRRAFGSFDPLAPPDTLALLDTLGRPAGLLVADPRLLASAQTWAPGEHAFDPGSSEFAASCTIPTPEEGVRGLLTVQDTTPATGDVWLVGENGVIVREEDGHIRIDIVGDPLFARRQCWPLGLFATPRFVKTINGIPPGPDGSFQITVSGVSAVDTILRVVPEPPDTLRIGLVGRQVDGGTP